jgi:hypothetical protein
MAPDSTLFVIDGSARRVVAFDSELRPLRTYGRAGNGPGEFVGPTTLAFWGRDTLAVMDLSAQAVLLFRRSDGAFIRKLQTPGVARSAASVPDALLLGTFSASSGTSAGILRSGDTAVLAAHPLPAPILANPLAMRAFPLTTISGLGDSVALLFVARSSLFIGKIGDAALAELPIPSRIRNAVPDSADAALAPIMQSPERMLLFPVPVWLEWRPDGLIVVVFRQFRARTGKLSGNFERADSEVIASVFVTIIDRAGQRACVDLEVPTDWSEQPTVFAFGDRIFALGHRIETNGSPTLELRSYPLPIATCNWSPIESA